MGSTTELELSIRESVGSEISLFSYGINSYRIATPFTFDDGDNYSIVLKKHGNKWMLTDEGHTLMHMSYDIDEKDLQKGTRAKILESIFNRHGLEDQNGSLTLITESDVLGPAVFEYIKALTHITDISYLNREQVKSTFVEDLKELVLKDVVSSRVIFNWHDNNFDPQGNYLVDCRINNLERPLMLFAINSDDKARDATITVHQFEKWNLKFNPIAIFEDQVAIQRSVLARLSDVFGKLFSSLSGNEDRISAFIKDLIPAH